MSLRVRNLDWLHGVTVDGVPDFGSRMHELVSDLVKAHEITEQQANLNLSGDPAPPPRLQRLIVTPTETGVHASITHEGEFYRGVEYHVEYADNQHFQNPFSVSLGPSREHDIPTGSRSLYWRAIAQYPTGLPTSAVYHGGTIPQPVIGGLKTPLGTSQGSGTGRAGEGLQGYGKVPYRGANPPVRAGK